jgi:hypothetical protein
VESALRETWYLDGAESRMHEAVVIHPTFALWYQRGSRLRKQEGACRLKKCHSVHPKIGTPRISSVVYASPRWPAAGAFERPKVRSA